MDARATLARNPASNAKSLKMNWQTSHYLPRDNGNTFHETFNSAVGSDPDWLLITNFKEWHENSYIKPSVNYGSTSLQLTAQLSAAFHNESVS